MKLKQQKVIYVILGIGFLVFFTLWILTEKENDTYENYLSDELVDKIAHISSYSNYNLGILEEVLKSGKITSSQAGELEQGFYHIAFDTQDISYMGNSIGRLQNYNEDIVLSVNKDYRHFFDELDFEYDEIKLTDEQITSLEKMEKLMKKYSMVVNETLKFTTKEESKEQPGQPQDFFDYYQKKGITDDYWIDLLKGYEKVTDESFSLY
ncbi:hypothetical protein [Virgibacillus doumboii]|uniref:hypothetical protein n=1 Tax=Virgibacillus doumboii TaxID=2697503 RepID=UPI0013DF168F|nr:hypothetical protein [Virgibacillus doumboii]